MEVRHNAEPKTFDKSGVAMAAGSLSYLLRHVGDRLHVPEAVLVPIAAGATMILLNLAVRTSARYVKPRAMRLRSSIKPKAVQLRSNIKEGAERMRSGWMRLLRRESEKEVSEPVPYT